MTDYFYYVTKLVPLILLKENIIPKSLISIQESSEIVIKRVVEIQNT